MLSPIEIYYQNDKGQYVAKLIFLLRTHRFVSNKKNIFPNYVTQKVHYFFKVFCYLHHPSWGLWEVQIPHDTIYRWPDVSACQ